MSAVQVAEQPPQMQRTAVRARRAKGPFAVIDKNIMPISDCPDPDIEAELDRLQVEKNIIGMVALFDALVAAADLITAYSNAPRCEGCEEFMDAQVNHLWSKAYAVADRLKRMKPGSYPESRARVLFDCAIEMGCNLEEAVGVAGALLQEV